MTIRSNKDYDQHAHEQPTQATDWASQNAEHGGGGGMGWDTRQAMRAAAAGDMPWHHSYDATQARRADVPTAPESSYKMDYGSAAASYQRGYRAGDQAHNSQLSALHMALNDPAGRNAPAPSAPLHGPELPYSHGLRTDDVRTERLNREAAAPGGSDERYFKRTGYMPGHRPDGGNG